MTGADLPYQYVVLRCVPRVDREEFCNVGVVLFCQEASVLDARWHLDAHRLSALAPDLDLAALAESLEVIAQVCAGVVGEGRPRLGRLGERFGWIVAPRSAMLQPGPVHGGVCVDPRAELDRLVDLLVR